MADLVVRAYNVGFGDAVLVSIPERTAGGRETVRHLLIDVGNLLVGEANADDVFVNVVQDIADRTKGSVDLYVMTHEHLDHVQGLLAAAKAGVGLKAKYAWLTGSAHPQYYENHPGAEKKRRSLIEVVEDPQRLRRADSDAWLAMMVKNNSLTLDRGLAVRTADYIDHLRTLAPKSRTHYVDRTTATAGKHPFKEASLRILAPEEDTSSYYGRVRRGPSFAATAADDGPPDSAVEGLPSPPPGVDPGAYFDLVRARRDGLRQNIREIDKANNNTSVVLEIEWSGWRLLFTGDAELKSWQQMRASNVLRPVHFVKISHHGSHNGTLDDHIEDVLPVASHDGRERHAIVSTHDDDWPSVPDQPTLDLYEQRATLHDTRRMPRGSPIEVSFPRLAP
jgi:beta-lactamase superfamily II metal-dependent hydrolase